MEHKSPYDEVPGQLVHKPEALNATATEMDRLTKAIYPDALEALRSATARQTAAASAAVLEEEARNVLRELLEDPDVLDEDATGDERRDDGSFAPVARACGRDEGETFARRRDPGLARNEGSRPREGDRRGMDGLRARRRRSPSSRREAAQETWRAARIGDRRPRQTLRALRRRDQKSPGSDPQPLQVSGSRTCARGIRGGRGASAAFAVLEVQDRRFPGRPGRVDRHERESAGPLLRPIRHSANRSSPNRSAHISRGPHRYRRAS